MNDPDPNFVEGMESLLGMDEQAVNKLIGKLDQDSLSALTDAVAHEDQEAAENIVRSFTTADEEVNPLFRAGNQQHDELEDDKKLTQAPAGHQFGQGDRVYVMQRDERGKKKYVGATVEKPIAPGGTIAVKIDGKRKMIDHHRIFIEEGVLGMTGVPDLQRIQQLAGLAPAGNNTAVQAEPVPTATVNVNGGAPDDAACQAMCALETLEAVLPNVRLAELKTIRQRIIAIQTSMNESAPSLGRDRKR
jgi:hypothetical protein